MLLARVCKKFTKNLIASLPSNLTARPWDSLFQPFTKLNFSNFQLDYFAGKKPWTCCMTLRFESWFLAINRWRLVGPCRLLLRLEDCEGNTTQATPLKTPPPDTSSRRSSSMRECSNASSLMRTLWTRSSRLMMRTWTGRQGTSMYPLQLSLLSGKPFNWLWFQAQHSGSVQPEPNSSGGPKAPLQLFPSS